MIRIYLAGGFHTNWQEKVVEEFKHTNELIFFNPKEHGLTKSDEYFFWDILKLEKCDIILAYLEKTNPLALGLVFELGYAKGLGKKVILVDDKTSFDSDYAKQFSLAKKSVDLELNSLDDAINYLKTFIN